MGLPELKGDPCWVYAHGPFDLAKRREIRQQAGDRRFVGIIRPIDCWARFPVFEFDEKKPMLSPALYDPDGEEYITMFPAAFSERSGHRWTVSAMVSVSYGAFYGDPLPLMVVIPDDVNHLHIVQWFFDNEHEGAASHLLGTKFNGPTGNKPTRLVFFFASMADRLKFMADFEITE